MTTVLNSAQTQVFAAAPENTFETFDNAACCSTENSLHQAGSNATKVRHFGIHGDICVTECIQFMEKGCAEEASVGRSNKHSIHQENPTGAGLGAGANNTCFTLTVCGPNTTSSGGGPLGGGAPGKAASCGCA